MWGGGVTVDGDLWPPGTTILAAKDEPMRSRRILYRLTWRAAALLLGHHLDHLIRHNAVGWWPESGSRPGPARGVALGHDRVIGHMGTIATLPRPCEDPGSAHRDHHPQPARGWWSRCADPGS